MANNKSALSPQISKIVLIDDDIRRDAKADCRCFLSQPHDEPMLDWALWNHEQLMDITHKQTVERIIEMKAFTQMGRDEFVGLYFKEFERAVGQVKRAALSIRHHLSLQPHLYGRLLGKIGWLRASDKASASLFPLSCHRRCIFTKTQIFCQGWVERMCKEIQRSSFVAFSILTTFLEKALGDVCTQSLSPPFLLSSSMADSLFSLCLSLSLSLTHTHTLQCSVLENSRPSACTMQDK